MVGTRDGDIHESLAWEGACACRSAQPQRLCCGGWRILTPMEDCTTFIYLLTRADTAHLRIKMPPQTAVAMIVLRAPRRDWMALLLEMRGRNTWSGGQTLSLFVWHAWLPGNRSTDSALRPVTRLEPEAKQPARHRSRPTEARIWRTVVSCYIVI